MERSLIKIELTERAADELEQLLIDISYAAESPKDIDWSKFDMDLLFDTLQVVEKAWQDYLAEIDEVKRTLMRRNDPNASWNNPK